MIFFTNGAKITMEINYEALGRYVAAKEQAEKFANERNQLLRKYKEMVDISSGNSLGYIAGDLPIAKLEEIFPQIKEAHENMLRAMDVANQAAEDCHKPKLTLYSRGY